MAFDWFSDIASRDSIFSFNVKLLFYVGLWPEENWSKTQKFIYKIFELNIHFLMTSNLIITGIGTYENIKGPIEILLNNLDIGLLTYHYIFKTILFIMKRKQLKTLITKIELSGDRVHEDVKKLMCRSIVTITALTTFTGTVISVIAIFNGRLSIEAWMPFDAKKNAKNLIMGTQIIVVTFVPCLYRSSAIQGLVCSIIMYLCEQLTELQDRLRVLKYSPENETAMRQEFRSIVKKHVRLVGYSNTLMKICKEFFLIQHLAITVELCLNAMMVTIIGFEKKTLLLSFMTFLGIALLNAYVYCYLGNELIIKSEGIAQAAYETEWTIWPLELQRVLLTMITAAQRPLHLSAGGMVTMSLRTYRQALYNGYSIFAVLNDAID